jgi:putative Mg2+ transporter-C (MgtC) family protein
MTPPSNLSHVLLANLLSKTVLRLMLAAFLGGIIGLERELKHRPAGLRTNMFICFGAAMFTILSAELAGEFTGDHTRIAAQIIPGIGFIGAGSILHSKGGISGLTTAATLFVVASIGMAAGGGLYLPAVFATILILLALQVLGWIETWLNLKPALMYYSIVTDKPVDEITAKIKDVLESAQVATEGMRITKFNGKERITFPVDGTRSLHTLLMGRFRQSGDLRDCECVRGFEHE